MRTRRPGRVWGVISLTVLVALMLSPIIIWFSLPHTAGPIALAIFMALSTWYSGGIVLREAFKSKSLPRISGGPSVSWDGTRYPQRDQD